MAPLRKEQYDKTAWSWAEFCNPLYITDENIKTAYRIGFPRCKVGTCRRNCKGNPHCLSNIGEQRWLGSSNDGERCSQDPEKERRQPNSFVGLKNLGATCYVNSLLQLWFHNLSFRKAICLWNPLEDPDEKDNVTLNADKYMPISIIGHLQVIFALMQYGNRRYLDPTDLIQCLRLDTTIQQDAQEFSKLFLSIVERNLNYQTSDELKNLIKNNFCGEYSYITRCKKCCTESACPSTFYELDLNIQGHKTLEESLQEFMMEELLQGEDRYYCAVCKEKQEAERFISLTKLPPVLNLQLMRFVFDKNIGYRKKLNSLIQFPETLNMTKFLPSSDGSDIEYTLSAVLVHSGRSANSGHYVAHICDSASGVWYKFNDETVEQIEGKKLKLGSDDEYEMEGTKKVKVPKTPKGTYQSMNAYMLVYTVSKPSNNIVHFCNHKSENQEYQLNPYLEYLIQEKNKEFDTWIEEVTIDTVNTINTNKNIQVEMASLITLLPVETVEEEFDAISANWLFRWMNEDDLQSEINNNKLICPHGKLDPKSMSNVKYISSLVADKLYDTYNGGPRLRSSNFECANCVMNTCYLYRVKRKTMEESKEINNRMKFKLDMDDLNFWVGKQSIRSWRRIVLHFVERIVCSGGTFSDFSYLKDTADSSATCSIYKKRVKSVKSENNCIKNMSDKNDASSNGNELKTFNGGGNDAINFQNGVFLPSEAANKLVQCYVDTLNSDCDLKSVNKMMKVALSEMIQLSPKDITIDSSKFSDSSEILELCKTTIGGGNGEINKVMKFKNSPTNNEKSFENHITPQKTLTNGNGNISDGFGVNKDIDNSKEIFSVNSIQPHTINGLCPRGKTNKQNYTEIKSSPTEVAKSLNDSTELQFSCIQTNDDGPEQKEETINKENDNTEEEEEEDCMKFNEDLFCSHKNLCIEENLRRLVPKDVWLIFKKYFPEAPEFLSFDQPCSVCKSIASEDEVAKGMYKVDASKQKDQLSDLYSDRNRPTLKSFENDVDCSFYIVNKEFLNSWKKFIRDAGKKEPPYSIKNQSTLLCESHSKLLYDVNFGIDQLQNLMTLVTQAEWNILSSLYNADVQITISSTIDGMLRTDPEVCEPCMKARLKNEEDAQLHYNRAKIYIRLLNPDELDSEECSQPPAKKSKSHNNSVQDDSSIGIDNSMGDNMNKSSSNNGPSSSSSIGDSAAGNNTPSKIDQTSQTNGGAEINVRRSARSRRKPGLKEIVVSSDLSLLDVKKKICSLLNVAPMDQHLSTKDGRNLTQNSATLTDLGIIPESILNLKVDEPCDGAIADEIYTASEPETGFKGKK